MDAAHQEKLMEREALAGRVYGELVETTLWTTPKLIDGIVELIERGKDSEQKIIQVCNSGPLIGLA